MATLSGIITPSNVLTETSTATVTNKTIAFGSNTFTGALPTTNGGTGLTALGTAGQLLAVNTEATALDFVAPPAPSPAGWNLLSTVTASASATADIETTFDSTYDEYVVVATGVLPATNEAILNSRLKINGSYQVANYVGVSGYSTSSSSTFTGLAYSVASPATEIRITGGAGCTNESYGGVNFQMRVRNPTSTSIRKQIDWDGSAIARSSNQFWQERLFGSARYEGGNQALTGVRFLFSTGNIATGTFRLYGIRKT